MREFATVDDLAVGWLGWNRLSEDEQEQAALMLGRASAYLEQLLDNHGIAVDPSNTTQMANLLTVTCNLVRRAMSPSYDGVRSLAQSVGSTNVSISYREHDGSFYLSKSEKDLLGITGRGKVFMLRPAIHAEDGSLVDGW